MAAEADLGKVRLTDAELTEKIIGVNGGVRLGKDADGNPGYVVTDAETGADTVIPFSKGGGGSLSEIEFPFYNMGITQPMYYVTPNTVVLRLTKTFPMKKIVVSGVIGGKTSSTSYTRSVSGRFTFYNKNEDGSMGTSETITLGTLTVSGTSIKTVTFNEVVIDLESIYFEDAVDSTNNPQFLLSLGGSYAYGYFYFTKIKGYM